MILTRTRLVAIAALLLAAILGTRALLGDAGIRLEPLRVSGATRVDAVPAAPGALHGRDVVLVTLDTTRPDRLGCYGRPHSVTPTLDRLAEEGVIFSRAVATAPSTLPTHASLMTGLYPHRHGARTNGLYSLSEEHDTLAEILASAGYDTAAFVSSYVLDSSYGMAQGFAHYDDEVGERGGLTDSAERRADATTDAAIAWLARERSAPYFLWVHYYDPHGAYEPPKEYRDAAAHPYDGELAFVDAQIARLLDAVGTSSRGEPLLVIAADHGEGFGSHGEATHSKLVQEATLRIPLILHAPTTLGRGLHVDARVSQVDIVATLGALLGIEIPADLDGVDLTQPVDPLRVVLAEAVDGHANFGWAPLTAVYRGSLKYVDGPNPELYDFAAEPLDDHDLAAERREEATVLWGELLRERGPEAGVLVPASTDLDAGDIAKLEALGYAVSSNLRLSPRLDGPDPKKMLPLMSRTVALVRSVETELPETLAQRIRYWLKGKRSPRSVIEELEAITREHPDFAPAYRYLGILYEFEEEDAAARRARERLHALFSGDEDWLDRSAEPVTP